MGKGIAIPPAIYTTDEGTSGFTSWQGVTAPLLEVVKCAECGHSFSIDRIQHYPSPEEMGEIPVLEEKAK